jgi:hypothetical protein
MLQTTNANDGFQNGVPISTFKDLPSSLGRKYNTGICKIKIICAITKSSPDDESYYCIVDEYTLLNKRPR